jgi:hypothetical protein
VNVRRVFAGDWLREIAWDFNRNVEEVAEVVAVMNDGAARVYGRLVDGIAGDFNG